MCIYVFGCIQVACDKKRKGAAAQNQRKVQSNIHLSVKNTFKADNHVFVYFTKSKWSNRLDG